MKVKFPGVLVVVLAVLSTGIPAFAHHGIRRRVRRK